jgi:hypothetical protein
VARIVFAIWAAYICVASWKYFAAADALADASRPSTPPARLHQLVHFSGIQAGYELDNRIAAHPNTPIEALRELHARGNMGTLMTLARNPNTPPDILHKLRNQSPGY